MTSASDRQQQRQRKAKRMASVLYQEMGEIDARKYIKDMREKAEMEDNRMFWATVNNRFVDLVNPPVHKKKPYQPKIGQRDLYNPKRRVV